MSEVTFTVPMGELEQFRAQFTTYVERAINSAVYRAQELARQYLPVRERIWEPRAGLREGFRIVVVGNTVELHFSGADTQGNPLIELLDTGAGMHMIEPGEKGLLAWQPMPGIWRYARGPVFHPGSMKHVGIIEKITDIVKQAIRIELMNTAAMRTGGIY